MNKEQYLEELKVLFTDEKIIELISGIEPPLLKISDDSNKLPYSKKLYINKVWENIEKRLNNEDDGFIFEKNDILSIFIETFNFFLEKSLNLFY